MTDAELTALTALLNSETEGIRADNVQAERSGHALPWADCPSSDIARAIDAELRRRRVLPGGDIAQTEERKAQ